MAASRTKFLKIADDYASNRLQRGAVTKDLFYYLVSLVFTKNPDVNITLV